MSPDAPDKKEGNAAEDSRARFVSPPPSDFDSLRQPLTEGELEVFNFFNECLAIEWEIYLQPHLNGLRPDIVLLNPAVGIGLFEVKDWDLSRAIYKSPKDLDDSHAVIPVGSGIWRSKPDPLTQVRGYEKELSTIYLPTLGARSRNLAVLSAGIIFTKADGSRAKEFLSESLAGRSPEFLAHHPIVGKDAIQKKDLDAVFPEANRQNSQIMNEEIAEDLRKWLREPESEREQRTPLRLDAQQRTLASERTESGFRRIRGPAGSGKSVILAQRAANLQRENKDVLIVYFNHALRSYLWDLVTQAGGNPRGVTLLGFHEWCKRAMWISGRGTVYSSVWRDDGTPFEERDLDEVFDQRLAQETSRALDDGPTAQDVPRYDAILVDEAQDFSPEWWGSLRKVRREGGEMLLLSDLTQDIYGQGQAWTEDVMEGAGFVGPWNTLSKSYRTPEGLTRLIADFRERFLLDSGGVAPVPTDRQRSLPFLTLRWRQVRQGEEVAAAVDEFDEAAEGGTYSDVGFVTSTRQQALAVERALRRKGIRCISTVDEDKKKDREKKMFFFKGDARVKVTTIHSFKGREMPRIILILSSYRGEANPSLAYSGLSRLSISEAGSSLSVVSSVPEFEEFGRTWPPIAYE